MYKKSATGWMKHLDFIIWEEISLQIAYILAYFIRLGSLWPYAVAPYRNLAVFMALIDFIICVVFNSMHNVMKRGYFKEFSITFRQCLGVFAVSIIGLFSLQSSVTFSRIILVVTMILHIIVAYVIRILWKKNLLRRGRASKKSTSMLAILETGTAPGMVSRLKANPLDNFKLAGIVLDKESGFTQIAGVPIVCKLDEASEYICREWIDAVYIDGSVSDPKIRNIIDNCRSMAVPIHYHIPSFLRDGSKGYIEKIGGTTVLTKSSRVLSTSEAISKRILDIIGGLVGSAMALVIIAIIGPKIKKESPGPILYKQERIGENGKHFTMLKIRSMYMDADERKAELMDQNRVSDGMMFKLEWDPRVIGNKELADGTRVTGIGEKIREWSLDEFPQFFCVLRGTMSLVGTRPPTVDEWEKYQFHHRARLACKPGITGMWQVSGRSDITDFEEVVKLDTEYITNWSLGLDIKIILQTVKAVLKKDGAM